MQTNATITIHGQKEKLNKVANNTKYQGKNLSLYFEYIPIRRETKRRSVKCSSIAFIIWCHTDASNTELETYFETTNNPKSRGKNSLNWRRLWNTILIGMKYSKEALINHGWTIDNYLNHKLKINLIQYFSRYENFMSSWLTLQV